MNYFVELVVNHFCQLGEGPVWDDGRKRILWIDIKKGEIHQFFPASGRFKTFSISQMVGSIALHEDEKMLAALQNGIAIVDLETETIQTIIDPEKDIAGNRFNEGKCDPAGRFWAGTMSLTEEHHAGSLYVMHNDYTIEKKISGVTISNGIAWSIDHQTIYYIDTPTLQVVSFDYDLTSGNISNKKVIIKISEADGYPDGMTIDTNGMLWVAHWGGWKITRWDPFNGKQLLQIDIPVSQVTSCTFGGDGLKDLYITSARTGLTEPELEKQPLAGSLFVIKNVGFTGTPAFKFKSAT